MEIALQCPKCGADVTSYKNPAPTADIVAFRDGHVLLILRKHPPQGWALPGGFVDYGETAESAAIRELREETNLEAGPLTLVGVYSDPSRDPRKHTLGVAFKSNVYGDLKAGDDALEAHWFPLNDLPHDIAFDHRKIIQDAQNLS